MTRAHTVLISGLGVAGPPLTFWLKAAEFQPILIEHAPALRSGGYVVDFWGLGYDIAERMGLGDEFNRIGYHIREMRIVNQHGKQIAGFGTTVFPELIGGRYVTIAQRVIASSDQKARRRRGNYFRRRNPDLARVE